MPELALDLEVLRKRRREDTFQARGDPADLAWLEKRLRAWLESRKWSKAFWPEFELVAREAGKWTQLAKVRA
jgi:hypothetical protein